MVQLVRVITESARRLHADPYIPVGEAGNQELVIIHKYIADRFSPVFDDMFFCLFGKTAEKFLVGIGFQVPLCQSGCRCRQEFPVICRMGQHFFHEVLAVIRHMIDGVSLILHGLQQQAHRLRRV